MPTCRSFNMLLFHAFFNQRLLEIIQWNGPCPLWFNFMGTWFSNWNKIVKNLLIFVRNSCGFCQVKEECDVLTTFLLSSFFPCLCYSWKIDTKTLKILSVGFSFVRRYANIDHGSILIMNTHTYILPFWEWRDQINQYVLVYVCFLFRNYLQGGIFLLWLK